MSEAKKFDGGKTPYELIPPEYLEATDSTCVRR